MLSIRPQYCGKILNKDKILEIRKSIPKCDLPCKVYIYCTKEKSYLDKLVQNHNGYYYTVRELVEYDADDYGLYYNIAGENGLVVAEFTLNKVEEIKENAIYDGYVMGRDACLSANELHNYTKGKGFYAWHIDNLKIYDEPKELSEFGIKRAFQSWGYVDEEEN